MCLVPDCPTAPAARGLCPKHLKRWQRHGDTSLTLSAPGGSLAAHIEQRVPEMGDECETDWPFATRMKGRPALHASGGKTPAVRYAFYILHGRWPTSQLNHTCHVAECWNPRHVYEGTQAQNGQDMLDSGRAWRQDQVSVDTANAVLDYLSSHSQIDTGTHFGISQGTVSRIARGVHWTQR